MDEQPDGEIHRVWHGRTPRSGASVPVVSGCLILLIRGYMFTHLEAL